MLAAGAIGTAQAEEARLLRFPATNGTEIVFTYAGDLYKVSVNGGEAVRLTSHIGYEMFARYSPDGKTIAFTGEYDGNREVYKIPSDGGEPVRLTYTSTNSRDDLGDRMGPNNVVMGWTRDGSRIIYRNRTGDSFTGKLWEVSCDGGMPEALPLPEGGFCSYSPDGSKLAYNRVFREFRTWKYYRGGMADDIWIYEPGSDNVKNITNNVAQDIIPMWIGDRIFFISDRDMTMNIFSYDMATGKTEKVTDFREYDVKFPSSDGKTIVFENGGYIYRLDPETGKYAKVDITLNGENVYARDEIRNVSGYVTGVSVSPDGKELAVTARGDVFTVPAGEGVTRNISRTPGANERNARWSPDGKNIAYISDRTGETEIWMQPAEDGNPVQLTKGNDTYIRSLQWNPDGNSILYTDRKNRVVKVDIASRSKKTILENPAGGVSGVSFSSDGKWITYTRPASNDMSVVYARELASGKEYQITEKWYSSSSPIFSTDGKYIIFNSSRDFNPIYGSLEWNHVYTRMGGLYLVPLRKDIPSPMLVAGDKPENGNAADKDQATVTGIDTEGIFGRIIRVPLGTGNFSNLYCDGKKLWYYSNGNTFVFDFASKKQETVLEGGSLIFNHGSKSVLARKGGKYYVSSLPSGKISLGSPVAMKDMKALIVYSEEWAQIYDEAWRAFRDGFYLENMHGIDWKAIKEKYAVLLPYVKTRLDLNYVIGEMISEVACGHAYVNPGEYAKPERVNMGLLGAEISRDRSGYYRIDKIIPGAPYSEKLRSSLTEPGMDINEGDFIVAINGIPTNTVDNIYKLLIGKADVLTEISVNAKASEDGARKVIVKPVANEHPLYHYNWVQNNIKRVEEATDGKVGYIYIPDMNVDGLNEFARYFYPQLDKEALIIDDRANGGGNVSPMIIERLLRKAYRMTMYRNSTKTGTIPDATHHGPKILLVNKYSASDGDLFPWSFKANRIGTIIGTRTWGGIVGISGSLPFIDGTDLRVPFFTNYDAETGEWIVENHGVDPDILIDNNPVKEAAGIDEQLEKAIEVALEQLKNRKPLPGVPAPRTFKDLGL